MTPEELYEIRRIADALTFQALWTAQQYKMAEEVLTKIRKREARRDDESSK